MTKTAPVPTPSPGSPAPAKAAHRIRYSALIAVMMMSFLLVSAEFLPNGVLTEMAASLDVTPGQAGQTVTVTALVGLLVAPTVGILFPRLDRRSLLVWMALAAAVSNLVVAIAPTLPLVLAARFLLGAAISAFWSMSITVASHIAGPERLGRAVMFTSAGTSLATVAGLPLGVMLAEATDWRTVFAVAGILSALLALALRLLLPRCPPHRHPACASSSTPCVAPASALGSPATWPSSSVTPSRTPTCASLSTASPPSTPRRSSPCSPCSAPVDSSATSSSAS